MKKNPLLYLPPETHCYAIRQEVSFCDSVNKSFTPTEFDDINETTFEGEWS